MKEKKTLKKSNEGIEKKVLWNFVMCDQTFCTVT